jgi:dephospho-CoA kinase
MARQMSLSEKALKSDFVVLNNRNDASNLIEEVTRAKEWLLRQA